MALTKSDLFRAFNMAKHWAADGAIDAARLNRALGVAQRKEPPADYVTTVEDCTCPDRKYRGVVCKHMIAVALKAVAS